MNILCSVSLIFLFSFGSEKYENILLSGPQSISIDLKNNVYIADTNNHRILKFNPNGEFIKSVGGFGWGKDQFDRPVDISAKSALDIFIADHNNHRIERYDKDLNYISSLYADESKNENLQFGYPLSMSLSMHGELFIIDGENIRLLKINSFGQPELSFGDFAGGKGRLKKPIQMNIGSDDRIYISDQGAGRLVVFDYFGNYLMEIGNLILKNPTGLFVDDQDNVWVADNGYKEIFYFSPKGEMLLRSRFISSNELLFKNPVDLVSTGNRLYVLDDAMIYVFEILKLKQE